MKQKNKTKNKIDSIIKAINKTRGRYLSLYVENSKVSQRISCKRIAEKDKTIIVQDRNNGNRNRTISKASLRGMFCGELMA